VYYLFKIQFTNIISWAYFYQPVSSTPNNSVHFFPASPFKENKTISIICRLKGFQI